MKLKKICSILKINTNYLNFDKDIDIYSVSDDSRNTKKKDLYISLKKIKIILMIILKRP